MMTRSTDAWRSEARPDPATNLRGRQWQSRGPTVDNRAMERNLGIVGGTGPESTADYYRTLIDTWRARGPANTYPRAMINSVEGGEIISLLGSGDYEAVGRLLSIAVLQLAAAGVGA